MQVICSSQCQTEKSGFWAGEIQKRFNYKTFLYAPLYKASSLTRGVPYKWGMTVNQFVLIKICAAAVLLYYTSWSELVLLRHNFQFHLWTPSIRLTIVFFFVLTFNSETGTKPPESCIFGQLLNIAAVVCEYSKYAYSSNTSQRLVDTSCFFSHFFGATLPRKEYVSELRSWKYILYSFYCFVRVFLFFHCVP